MKAEAEATLQAKIEGGYKVVSSGSKTTGNKREFDEMPEDEEGGKGQAEKRLKGKDKTRRHEMWQQRQCGKTIPQKIETIKKIRTAVSEAARRD